MLWICEVVVHVVSVVRKNSTLNQDEDERSIHFLALKTFFYHAEIVLCSLPKSHLNRGSLCLFKLFVE